MMFINVPETMFIEHQLDCTNDNQFYAEFDSYYAHYSLQ